jgi:hypothetical protein
MILPTKHLSAERALLTVGALLLQKLAEPKSVTVLWDEIRKARKADNLRNALGYDWFVLALDLLFITGAVRFESGVIIRGPRDTND